MNLAKNKTVISLRKGNPVQQTEVLNLFTDLSLPLPTNIVSQIQQLACDHELPVDLRQQVMSCLGFSNFLQRDAVLALRTTFDNKRIKLIKMFDKYAVDPDTKGTVTGVDDAGQLMVSWDNGRTLSINFDAGDMVEIIDQHVKNEYT